MRLIHAVHDDQCCRSVRQVLILCHRARAAGRPGHLAGRRSAVATVQAQGGGSRQWYLADDRQNRPVAGVSLQKPNVPYRINVPWYILKGTTVQITALLFTETMPLFFRVTDARKRLFLRNFQICHCHRERLCTVESAALAIACSSCRRYLALGNRLTSPDFTLLATVLDDRRNKKP